MKSNKRVSAVVFASVILYFAALLNAATPWLHTDANKIKDPDGNIVVLRGVDTIDIGATQVWYGGLNNLIDRITNKSGSPGWYTKVIRLAIYPENEDGFTGGPWYFETNHDNYYNNLLRPAVDYCKTKDIYVIIDWHYVGDNTYDRMIETTIFWDYMAPRFAGDSHVLFELFNEPLNTSGGNDVANWLTLQPDMQTWIDLIRTMAPNNLILVGGPQWSQQIGPSAAYPLDGDNLVMVVHIYPGHWLLWGQEGFKSQVQQALTRYPVFATEWGFWGTEEPLLNGTITDYGQPLMDYYESLKISNSAWCASYAWNPPMFNWDWTLRVGEAEMGGFVKDTLYLRRDDDQPGSGDTTPPAAPTGLSATAGESQVSLDWNNNTELDLAGYNVYRAEVSGGPYTKQNGPLVTTSAYIDNNVDGYVTYYYVVRAVDTSSNESGNSNQASATPTDTTPPAAPTGLSATTGDSLVSLNWDDNSAVDLAGYNVYRSTTSGSGYTQLNDSLLTSSDYVDNSVNNGTTYYYVVTAVDTSSNQSLSSSEVSATPQLVTDIEILGSWATGTSHTKENGNSRALVFIAHAEVDTALSLTSVSYGGQSMTKVADVIVGTSWRAYVAVFILNEAGVAAATSGTFTPVWSDTPDYVAYSSVFIRNVDQTDLTGVFAVNSTATSTPNPITTAALAANDGDMVFVAATCGNAGNYSLNNGFTEGTGTDQQFGNPVTATGVAGHKSATGSAETPSATYNTGPNRQVILGFVVNAQSGTGYSNCGEVIGAGYRLAADIAGTGDCYVDYYDLDTFVEYWLNIDCAGPDNCHGADFEPADGVVDLLDFSDFAAQWLICNDPEDPECPHNW